MKRAVRVRKLPASLSPSLQRNLSTYTLAAGAAGVGVLALALPAEGRVIFTSIHHVIKPGHTYPLDLNHDGIPDVSFRNTQGSTGSECSFWADLDALAPSGNGVAAFGKRPGYARAYALRVGQRIGPKFYFFSSALMAAHTRTVMCDSYTFGPWVGVNKRYLGVRFKTNGKDHYGWARLSVKVEGFTVTATLTGYAYETVANRVILAGPPSIGGLAPARHGAAAQTEGPPNAKKLTEPSLGMLAIGSQGLSVWRREQEAVTEAVP